MHAYIHTYIPRAGASHSAPRQDCPRRSCHTIYIYIYTHTHTISMQYTYIYTNICIYVCVYVYYVYYI